MLRIVFLSGKNGQINYHLGDIFRFRIDTTANGETLIKSLTFNY